MAIATLAGLEAPDSGLRDGPTVFGLQLALNFIWSILLLATTGSKLAFAEVLLLWLAQSHDRQPIAAHAKQSESGMDVHAVSRLGQLRQRV